VRTSVATVVRFPMPGEGRGASRVSLQVLGATSSTWVSSRLIKTSPTTRLRRLRRAAGHSGKSWCSGCCQLRPGRANHTHGSTAPWSRVVEKVPIECVWTESFFVNPSAEEREAERGEQALVIEFEEHLGAGTTSSGSRSCPQGSIGPSSVTCSIARRTSWSRPKDLSAGRLCVWRYGQLFDYRRFVGRSFSQSSLMKISWHSYARYRSKPSGVVTSISFPGRPAPAS
jgi:hypothetical protein